MILLPIKYSCSLAPDKEYIDNLFPYFSTKTYCDTSNEYKHRVQI